ncbi:MAG: hypothetical protein KDJ52_32440 [Anaerolineae bacterium]|nr:hypothetical protein [Anaerolineae bacterium]
MGQSSPPSPVDLSSQNLVRPYSAPIFVTQLLQAGIPQRSIDALLHPTSFMYTEDERLEWLYHDIADDEARIIAGERHSQVVGIFITDGHNLLLERSTALGRNGEQFKMGGQIPLGKEPREIACQEITEETPLQVNCDELVLLGSRNETSSNSPKLPGVTARKQLIHFKYAVSSFDQVTIYLDKPFLGADGHEHDLLLVPIIGVLADSQIKRSYKNALQDFYSQIIQS